MHKNNQEFAQIESELNLSMDQETKTMMSIYEELSKRISALEQLLPNEINKYQISTLLIHSLLTENPIHTLDEIVRLLRSKAAKQKIITCASKFFNGDYTVTNAIVSSLVQILPIIKASPISNLFKPPRKRIGLDNMMLNFCCITLKHVSKHDKHNVIQVFCRFVVWTKNTTSNTIRYH